MDIDINAGGISRVLKLPVGFLVPAVLPFTGLGNVPYTEGAAVDNTGTLYVTDGRNHPVLELPASATAPTVLPVSDLTHPTSVAVDSSGSLYVTDVAKNSRVLKVVAGSSASTVLPFTGLTVGVVGVAVDRTGNVYVAESGADSGGDRVVKLAAG